jgi:phage/plasmid primase-like uncharacterized protein
MQNQSGRTAASYRAERAQRQAKKAREAMALLQDRSSTILNTERKGDQLKGRNITVNKLDKRYPLSSSTDSVLPKSGGLLTTATTIFEEGSSEASDD